MRKLLACVLMVVSAGAVSQERATGELAKKLVDGSPWRFTTRFENTVRQFRFTGEGKLQQMSSGNSDGWIDQVVTEAQTITYNTIGGHVITFSLGADGNPIATHSKHPSGFKSIK